MQEFWLQPLTLPLEPQRTPPRWHSRTVWAHVTANEHDPKQQGRVQVEFEWEHLDPQPSSARAWLHTLTPYGGGAKPDAQGKATAYNGFYSLPEVGERVLVEFLGEWDSEAVIAGAVREHPVSVHHNPHHAKRWRTPAGNEISLVSRGGTEVVQMHTKDKLVFESQVSGSGQSVLLTCGEGGAINALLKRCRSQPLPRRGRSYPRPVEYRPVEHRSDTDAVSRLKQKRT